MIDIDTSRPAHETAADLERFVRAVVAGLEPDEWTWIECKSSLDLRTTRGQFAVARAVIGFANRTPAVARLWCGGWGYVVVGASPGKLDGTEVVDGQQLKPAVGTYIGPSGDAPAWEPHWVEVDGTHVMIAAIAPPEPGSTIWTLRKTYSETAGKKTTTTSEGTILVRDGSETRPPSTLQVRGLVERARDAGVDLVVRRVDNGAVGWLDLTATGEQLAEWVAGRQEAVLARHPRQQAPWSQIKRYEQFRAETEAWAAELQNTAIDRTFAALAERYGEFRLEISHSSNAHLEDVELILDFPPEVPVADGEPPFDVDYLPNPPNVSSDADFLQIVNRSYISSIAGEHVWTPGPVDVTIEDSYNGGQRVIFDIGEVRRGGRRHVTTPVWLRVSGETSPPSEVTVPWTATVRRPAAWGLSGTVTVPIAGAPVTFLDLIDAVEADE